MARTRRHDSTAAAHRVQFATFSPSEDAVVDRIVARALGLFREHGVYRTPIDVRMDLSAVHARVPLRLEELERADDFNFAHDVTGIYRHLNRDTGELEDCFRPRFAAH